MKWEPNGSKLLFTYDFLDRVIKVKHEERNGSILCETSAIYTPFALIKAVDAEGVETCIEYDGAGREKRITKGTCRVEKIYDSLGFLAEQKEWYSPSNFLSKCFVHDAKGQLLEETCVEGDKLYAKKTYAYDASQNRTKMVSYADLNSPEETIFVYDVFGREIKKTDPLGYIWKTVYRDDIYNDHGGCCACKNVIKPDGNEEETVYDARGRAVKISKKDNKGQTVRVQEFRYDGLSNLISSREGDVETRFFYEGKKQIRILEEANHENPRETLFTYSPSGELVHKETPLVVHKFSYDGLGRVVSHKACDQKGAHPLNIVYEYDRNGKPLKIAQNGKETLRKYDENGFLIFEKQESGLSISYRYDYLGRRIAMQLPDNSSLEYEYLGPYLHSLTRFDKAHKQLYLHTYLERDLSGRITSSQMIDNKKVLFEYDAIGKITSLQASGYGQRVKYNASGNLTELVTHDPLGIFSEHFAYTHLNQLSQENGNRYEYDDQENRLDGKIGPFNQLISAIGCAFSWNEEGYLTGVSGSENFSCAYDSLGRMLSFQNIDYAYDGLNRRIKKNGTYFLYDGANEIGLCNDKGEFLEFRALGEGKAEAGATVAIEIGKKVYSVVNDIRGNVAFLAALSGKEWEYIRYSAFGEAQIFLSNPKTPSQNPWRFCGKREDSESGLVFFGRRYYMPKLGRWTSPDPIQFADGSNLYAFVHNNPLTHFDLYGLHDALEPLGSKNLIDFCDKLYHMAMSTIEWIGKNLIPIPGIRDMVEDIGRGLGGGSFFEPAEYLKSTTQIHLIEGRKIEGHTHVWINGVRTTFDDAIKAAAEFSKRMEGVQVLVIYNATNGLLTDLLECFMIKLGMVSAPERKILECVRNILANSPNEIVHIQAHSQGGLHLFNAGRFMSKGEREHLEVNTLGSAKIIPDKMFKIANNYISKLDLVSVFDPFNYISARFGHSSNVTFLSPSSFSPLREHSILGETYQEQTQRIAEQFLKEIR